MKKTKIVIIALFSLFVANYKSFAQEEVKFEELKDAYFKDRKYSEFAGFLKSLSLKDKALMPQANYYIALTRYNQLKYLEETQNWSEYFERGNAYKDEISSSAQKVIEAARVTDAVNIYARLLLWQLHKDQQDSFTGSSLSDLMSAVSEYSKSCADIKPIRETADKLFSYEEKGKAKELYRIYVGKLLASDINADRLKDAAFSFYKDGNLELSEAILDAYVEKAVSVLPKEKLLSVLTDIAKMFAYKNEGPNDLPYAEKIFKKIEEAAGKEALNEELAYLRYFSLEKAKEFPAAKDGYLDLLQRFSRTSHGDELNYKIGIICAYALKDIKTGREYFEKLSQKETLSPQVISGLYQLGLLSQWENDLPKARDYYARLIEKAGDSFTDTVSCAKDRIREIDEQKPLDYNLKAFMDASLNEDAREGLTSSASASIYVLKKEEETRISSDVNPPVSGCTPVELQYLWSGDLGKPKLAPGELSGALSFNTSYANPGTKVVHLVVISTSGVVDRSMDIIDVY